MADTAPASLQILRTRVYRGLNVHPTSSAYTCS